MSAKSQVRIRPRGTQITKRMKKLSAPLTDAILPMNDPYMMQIVKGQKNYKFRKYQLAPSIKRIWFYRTAPHSHLAYICEIDPGVTRGRQTDAALPEIGLGNKEFNEGHKDWEGCDWAYRIRSVYKVREPVALKVMRDRFGFKLAPRSLVYVPSSVKGSILWEEQGKDIAEGSNC